MDKPFTKTVGRSKQALKLGLALALAAMINGAFTQTAKAQDQDDPPGRVARLGYMEGQVSFQPAGENEWVGAVPNRPMTTGDKLWIDRDSRAEIQLGSSTIDVAPNTGLLVPEPRRPHVPDGSHCWCHQCSCVAHGAGQCV